MSPPSPPSLKRPRGLWKQRQARAADPPNPSPWPNQELRSHDRIADFLRSSASAPSSSRSTSPSHLLPCSPSAASSRRSLAPSDHDESDDDDADARSCTSSGSSKRRRLSGHFSSDSEFTPSPTSGSAHDSSTPLSDHLLYNAHLHIPIPPSLRSMSPISISRAPSAASDHSKSKLGVHSADYEDWENLKELFARAADRYDGTCSPPPAYTYLFLSGPAPPRPRPASALSRSASRATHAHPLSTSRRPARGPAPPPRRHPRVPPLPD